jgi:hypothetical protein
MDYLDLIYEAFGAWDESSDEHAALKFCIDDMFRIREFNWLINLLNGSEWIQYSGNADWELERCIDSSKCPDWPPGSIIRASVPCGLIGIEQDEVYVDLTDFLTILGRFIEAYKKRSSMAGNPEFKKLVAVYEKVSRGIE